MREVNAHGAPSSPPACSRGGSRASSSRAGARGSASSRARARARRSGRASRRPLVAGRSEVARPLEEKLAHSPRRRREQVVEADEALATAWVETLRWQRRAKEAEEARRPASPPRRRGGSAAAEAMAAEAKAAAARAAEGAAAAARREAALRMEVEDLRTGSRDLASRSLEGAWCRRADDAPREAEGALLARERRGGASALARVAELEGQEAADGGAAARADGALRRPARWQLDEGRTALRTTLARSSRRTFRGGARGAARGGGAAREPRRSRRRCTRRAGRRRSRRCASPAARGAQPAAEGRRRPPRPRPRARARAAAVLARVPHARRVRPRVAPPPAEGERRLAELAPTQPLALSSVMQSVSNLGLRSPRPTACCR